MIKNPFKKLKLEVKHAGKVLAVSLEDGEIINFADSLKLLRGKLNDFNGKYAIVIMPNFERFHDDDDLNHDHDHDNHNHDDHGD